MPTVPEPHSLRNGPSPPSWLEAFGEAQYRVGEALAAIKAAQTEIEAAGEVMPESEYLPWCQTWRKQLNEACNAI